VGVKEKKKGVILGLDPWIHLQKELDTRLRGYDEKSKELLEVKS
jgi:hypothetical protein